MAYYLLSTGWYLKITLTYVLTNNKYHIETVLSDKFKPLKKSFFFLFSTITVALVMHLAFVWLYFFGMGIPFAIFFPLVLGSRLFFQKSQFYFPVSLAFFITFQQEKALRDMRHVNRNTFV